MTTHFCMQTPCPVCTRTVQANTAMGLSEPELTYIYKRDLDRLRADLARAQAVVLAAEALVEHWRTDPVDGDLAWPWGQRLHDLTDALAAAVAGGDVQPEGHNDNETEETRNV